MEFYLRKRSLFPVRLAPKRAPWYFHITKPRSMRSLGCIARSLLRASCLLRFLASSLHACRYQLQERDEYITRNDFCTAEGRHEINALSEDSSEPFLYGLKFDCSDCKSNLDVNVIRLVFTVIPGKSVSRRAGSE